MSETYKALAKTTPPPPKTGKMVRGCYAGALNDCDEELTKEHWISKSVLLEVSVDGETFITNAACLPKEGAWIPAANYAAKVLCKRHNEALSPLDREGQRFFQLLEQIDQAASTGGDVPAVTVFSGHDIERWMLKALCGAIACGAFQTHRAERLRGEISREWLDLLFSVPYLPRGWGLSFPHRIGEVFSTAKNVGLAPLLIAGDVVGVFARLRGLQFALVLGDVPLETRGGSLSPSDVYRPTGFRITYGENRETLLRLYWDVAPPEPSTVSIIWKPPAPSLEEKIAASQNVTNRHET